MEVKEEVEAEGNAKEKLQQMLEAQKAQDPNFAKLKGTQPPPLQSLEFTPNG